ncbi:MAG: hypothetical protein ABFS86_00275 [Planctomycetota bacterium]
MKDLKIVIAIAVPLVLVAGGFWALSAFLGPAGDAPVVVDPGPESNGGRPPLHQGSVPREDWPRQEGAGANGLAPMGEREVKDGGPTPTLTLDLLRKLLEAGDAKAFARIEFLLRQGVVEEPFEVAKLLMQHLDKGGNFGAQCARMLPLLTDERVRERIATGLLAMLPEFKDRNGLSAAIEVIGVVGGPSNVEALAVITRTHESRNAVAQALYAMAKIGGPEAAGELVGYLRLQAGDQNQEALALRAIEKLKTDDMVKAIDGMLAEDQAKETRILGVKALGMAAGTPAASKRLLDLADEGGEIGLAAGLQLGHVTGKEATDPFIPKLDEVKDVRQRAGMVKALGTNGSEAARAKCYEVFSRPDEPAYVRAEGALSLAKMGDDRGVTVMLDIVSNPREETRTLDGKVLRAIRDLAVKNRDAGRDMKKNVLPALKKRYEEDSRHPSIQQLKITIMVLEQAGGR